MPYEKEVELGSAWLDQTAPGWWKKIDINALKLSDYSKCTVGQTFGGLASQNLCNDSSFSIPRGFIIGGVKVVVPIKKKSFIGEETILNKAEVEAAKKAYDNAYSLLTSQWIQEILRRRAAENMQSEAIKKGTKTKEEEANVIPNRS